MTQRAKMLAGVEENMSAGEVLNYVKAHPFRPFCIRMNSGRRFDIRHPEMIRVGRDFFILFTSVSDSPDVVDHWETASLLLVEAISHLDAQVA
jgi:hypothetical protein